MSSGNYNNATDEARTGVPEPVPYACLPACKYLLNNCEDSKRERIRKSAAIVAAIAARHRVIYNFALLCAKYERSMSMEELILLRLQLFSICCFLAPGYTTPSHTSADLFHGDRNRSEVLGMPR